MRRLRIAMAGLGQGAAGTLPALAAMPEFHLIAGADMNPRMRAGFEQRYPGTRTYAAIAELARDPEVEAIWVATPNRFHCEHGLEGLRNGKHVIVEKPMAISLAEADEMIDAAQENGVQLLAGHTRSLSIWNNAMREIIRSGELGALRAIHVSASTDWMIRPRLPEELDPALGGGIVFRQGPHQIDTIRLLGGGMLRSVRATTGSWMPERAPSPGYYNAHFEFEDGTPASVMHNGYGYFVTTSLYPWVADRRGLDDEKRAAWRRELRDGKRDDASEKEDFRVGGRNDPALRETAAAAVPYAWKPFDLGEVEVVCERGVMRPAQWGLTIYDDAGERELDLRERQRPEADPSGGLTLTILEELYHAVVEGTPAIHTGEWGRATLEAVLAVMTSAQERREITLAFQVPLNEPAPLPR